MKLASENIFLTSTSVELHRVEGKDLREGMYVSKLDRPWVETNFLFQGFMLQNQADLKAVQAQCDYVYIDMLKTRYQEKQLVIKMQEKPKPKKIPYSKDWLKNRKAPPQRSNFIEEIRNAEHVYHQASTIVKTFMQEISLGKSINVEIAKRAVAECVKSVLNAPDALMWLTQLKNHDEYTSQHSMNVCILAISLGRQLSLLDDELNELGLCGMMHDIGKIKVPLAVLNKPGRLDKHELKYMNNHTTAGWQLLLSTANMTSSAIDVAYSHHERLDGKGYPRGLTEEQITPYAKMVAIVDMYDAITSDRVYQKGRTHLEALSIMTREGGTHLDLDLTVKFIESLGIYPAGSIVEMSNGEVAIVIETNQKMKTRPLVIFILDKDKKPQQELLVNLATMNFDEYGKPYRVVRIVRPEEYNINLHAYYHSGIFKKDGILKKP